MAGLCQHVETVHVAIAVHVAVAVHVAHTVDII